MLSHDNGLISEMVIDEAEVSDELRAPFPWFGGKRRVADLVWSRLGNVATYNEPFAGSLAVLLGRPHAPRVETVNDLDAYLANFWRALQRDPEGVSYHADGPVNEADLHARHRWLVDHRPEQVMSDPSFYDAQIAGWWVWGQCLWIGSGWCQVQPSPRNPKGGSEQHRRPHLTSNQGVQIPRKRFTGPGNGQGTGVHRRWQGGGQGGGSGVHAPRLTHQMPRISAEGGSISGVTAEPLARSGGLYDYLESLSLRLRRVRVCCGDWKRVLTPSVTTYIGECGVFLDPPYSHELRERCYSEDHDISAEVREWALANGDNRHFRIALCGYEGEHQMPDSWECVPWKAHGGYSRSERGVANRERERIWFSPHCLKGAQRSLFEVSA
jgi:site-specific DNA-adenine methylase